MEILGQTLSFAFYSFFMNYDQKYIVEMPCVSNPRKLRPRRIQVSKYIWKIQLQKPSVKIYTC